MSIMNFSEASGVLRQFYNASAGYKLDAMRQFMTFLGNPQNNLRIIHVAGTSGKTSTAYYVAALLQASGYSVGLTVSPHVDEINERAQINLEPLPEAVFCQEIETFLKLVTKSGLVLSYFEVMVAFAYWYFAKTKVDYAVIEVGLGGRIDGTNVVSRQDKICVITDIGLDHTKILGDTLPQIAAEKAGIITRGNEVFTHHQTAEILDVFKQTCQQKQAVLHIVDETTRAELSHLPLFQQHNFQLAQAVAMTTLARQQKTLNKLSVQQAANVYIPARMEVIRRDGKAIIVDGAHNGQKLHALFESITAQFPNKPIAALVAFVDGDELRMQEGLNEIINQVEHVIVTEFEGEQDLPKRSVSPHDITDYLEERAFSQFEVIVKSEDALTVLMKRPEPVLLVTGSFYLLNHIRPSVLKLTPSQPQY